MISRIQTKIMNFCEEKKAKQAKQQNKRKHYTPSRLNAGETLINPVVQPTTPLQDWGPEGSNSVSISFSLSQPWCAGRLTHAIISFTHS